MWCSFINRYAVKWSTIVHNWYRTCWWGNPYWVIEPLCNWEHVARSEYLITNACWTISTVNFVIFYSQFRQQYPWSRWMAERRVLISMDSRILRRHILSSRAITLTLSIFMGCSWSPTAVRGDFCFRWSFIIVSRARAVSPTYFAGIPDTGFHRWRHTFHDQVSCLWGGPGWSSGYWRACGKPRLRGFLKFWPVFRMYLIYGKPTLVRAWPLWCYERCRTCLSRRSCNLGD